MYTHWMKMPRKGWIKTSDRMPTEEDADREECVLARHELDGIQMAVWHRFANERRLTHWMPTPPPPVDGGEWRKRF